MSFTKAASELCITQGAVSQQVKLLEEWLHRPLFLRHPRALVLTPEGQWLAVTLREAFGALEGTLARLKVLHDSGPLVLSCAPSFAIGWLTPRLGDFFRLHPELELRVNGEFHALDLARMARDGVAAAVRFDLGSYQDLEASAFLDEWLMPVASPDYLAAHPELRDASDLQPSQLLHDISAWEGAGPFEEWQQWFDDTGMEAPMFDGGRHFNLSQLAIAAAIAGQGVAIGRAALMLEELETGRLVVPFGRAVRSRAAYHFVAPLQPSTHIRRVHDWITAQATRFQVRRDAVLERLLIRAD